MVYISGQETKPSPEELCHYGVKGMRWGVRKDRASKAVSNVKSKAPKLSDRQKKVAKASGGVTLVAGVAAASYIIGKKSGTKLSDAKAAARIDAGREFVVKSLWGDATAKPDTLYRLTPSEVSYVDYLIRDTFKNRV